jgi:hypothetical protein
MRRPNRSIEVFDISLMAVVTKAMGAFLVLMLLLMPYYTSEPLSKSASDLQKALAEAEAQLIILIERLKKAERDPSELLRALEDLRRQLEEARRLVALLRRDNDALNAQVRRLEAREAELRRRVERLEAENRELRRRLDQQEKIVVSGQLVNWNCPDSRLEIGLWFADAKVYTKVPPPPPEEKDAKDKAADRKESAKKDTKGNGDLTGDRKAAGDKDSGKKGARGTDADDKPVRKRPQPVLTQYVLNHWSAYGYAGATSDQDVVTQLTLERSSALGTNHRFNQSYFTSTLSPGTYFVVLTVRSNTPRNVDGISVYPLRRANTSCRAIVSKQYIAPKKNNSSSFWTVEKFIPKGEYAIIESELVVKEDTVVSQAVSTRSQEWLKDQIAHAEREDVLTPEEMEKRRQEAERRRQELERQRRESEVRRMEFEQRARERREEAERLRREQQQREGK